MREWLKVGFILTLVFGGYIFADVKMSEKYPNVPASWPEECISKLAKENPQRSEGYSICYKINQKFDGGYFFKDTNTWVVTPKFAKTFGMPDEFISNELQGVEAIAYRSELVNNHTICGMGSIETNCMNSYYGVLDVYIDEKKTPLPWIRNTPKNDFAGYYNSSQWLMTENNDPQLQPKTTQDFIPNNAISPAGRLRPFADPVTKHEAAYFQDLHDADDWQAIVNGIYGYKRDAIEGLTVISFFYSAENVSNDGKPRTFRLISDFTKTFGSKTKETKQFHQFYIPASFIKTIKAVDEARKKRDREFFQETLNKMGYEIKVKEPAKDTNDTGFFQKIFK